MEAAVSEVVTPEELLTSEWKYNGEELNGVASRETTLEYASCLIRSRYSGDIEEGIALLVELMESGGGGATDGNRDLLFYLSVANYRLNEFEKALGFIGTLLRSEPENRRAADMERLIDQALRRDGLVGMAIVGGICLAAVGLAAGLIGWATSKGGLGIAKE